MASEQSRLCIDPPMPQAGCMQAHQSGCHLRPKLGLSEQSSPNMLCVRLYIRNSYCMCNLSSTPDGVPDLYLAKQEPALAAIQ